MTEYNQEVGSDLLNNWYYKQVVDAFYALDIEQDVMDKVEEILKTGKVGGYDPKGNICRNLDYTEERRRVGLAYLLVNNPDTFDYIKDSDVIYFHGTDSSSLDKIIESRGMESLKIQKLEGKAITNGEIYSRDKDISETRGYISFTDVLDLAEEYSSRYMDEEGHFPVVIGVTRDTGDNFNFYQISGTYLPEAGCRNRLPIENIKCILVPSEHVEEVYNKVSSFGIQVLGMDNIGYKFYYFEDAAPLEYYSSLYDRFIEITKKKNIQK